MAAESEETPTPRGGFATTSLEWLTLLGAIAVLIAVGEIPAVHSLSDWINGNRSWLLPITLGSTVAGLLVLLCGWVIVGIKSARPMSAEEAAEFMGQPIVGPGMQSVAKGRFRGVAHGRKIDQPMEWSFREMKVAWHEGSWCRDPDMRQKYFITAGGLLAILGGFAVLMVLSKPPSVKLLMAGTAVYALARTIISFVRA